MNKNQKVLLALIAGVAAGAAAAVLLAAEDGKTSRKKLTDWAEDLLNTSKDKISNLKKQTATQEENEETTLGI